MSNEKFRVKFGLAVGDTSATIDGTSGDIVTNGDLSLGGGEIVNPYGPVNITSGAAGNITITPDTTGDIILSTDTVIVGDANTNAALTTNGTGDLTLNTNGGVNSGSITIAQGTNANITVEPNGSGDILLRADTVQVGDQNVNAVITTYGTGDLILSTNGGVTSGSILIADGADADITLTPNGTGNVAIVNSNGGNLTGNRNFVLGAIRNTTTDAAGNIWNFNQSIPSTSFRGVSVDNSGSTAAGAIYLARTYGTGTGVRPKVVFERARGTAASPTALQAGDIIGSIESSGANGAGTWVNDSYSVTPAFMQFNVAENWVSNTNLGAGFKLALAPTATTITANTGLTTVIDHTPQAATYKSDSWTFQQGKTGTQNWLTMSASGITTTNDVQTFKNTAGTTNYLSLNTTANDYLNATHNFKVLGGTYGSIVIPAGATGVQVNQLGQLTVMDPVLNSGVSKAQIYTGGTSTDGQTYLELYTINNDGQTASTTNYTSYRFDGTNFSPTLNGDALGVFKANGNVLSGPSWSAPVAGALVKFEASENWSSTAMGSKMYFVTNKKGTLTGYNTLVLTPEHIVTTSDLHTLRNLAGTNLLEVDSTGEVTIAGNVYTDLNYVFGSIRNANTEAAGYAWSLGNGAGIKWNGVSLDNSNDNSTSVAFIGRTYTSSNGLRPRLIMERARGTTASPTALQSGDYIYSLDATGYSTTGWLSDTIQGIPAFIGIQAAENWISNTNVGTTLNVLMMPTATTFAGGTSSISIINANPQTFAQRSDAFTWANGKTGTTQTMALDVSGNLTITGDLRINGNDIKSSDGTTQITTSAAGATLTLKGDAVNLQTAAGASLNASAVTYDHNYGEFAYVNASGFGIAAQNTIYTMPLDTTLNANNITISGTGNININKSGWYKVIMSLQTVMTTNSVGSFKFWLRKNGLDVSNSATEVDLLKDQKAVIAMDWLVNSNGADYFEIVYASSSSNYADIAFPTIAATTTPYIAPAAPALIVNVIPIGM